jgi:phosphomannomutase/phosphoglucomutase
MKPSLKIKGLENLNVPAFLKNPIIFILIGLSLICMMAILLFSGSSGERNAAKAYQQGERASAQLREAVVSFQRLLNDPQVISLAEMALADPQANNDLSQYLAGRAVEFKGVELYQPTDYLKNKTTLGENAWIAIDMMLVAKANKFAPVQIFDSGGESVIASMVAIGEPENLGGFLMIKVAPEMILSSFNMTMPLGGYIALQQDHGKFTPSIVRSYGDPQAATAFSKIPVGGSLLSVVVPKIQNESTFSGFQRLMVFLFGAMMLAFGILLRRHQLHPVSEIVENPANLQDAGFESEDSLTQSTAMTGDLEIEPEPAVESEAPAVSLPDLPFDINERRRSMRPQQLPVELLEEIFREYDIRGIVGQTLDSGVARQVGQAIGSVALEAEATPVVVGRDGRHSGPDLVSGMIEGISSTGCDVVDVGAVPTGVLYYAAYESGSGSGVMVTGSHNPPDYNGFKVMMGGKTLAGENISNLYQRIEAGGMRVGKGQVTKLDVLDAYRDKIAGDIQLERPLKVVVDCGNGIGGICAADILRSIGAEVFPMFDEVDGSFPNHHPDPSDPKNLEDLIDMVKLMDADLGVAFDGDADRLGVVTPEGEIIFADRTMMLFIREILGRNPGAKIIYDVKCTGKLDAIIREAGGEPEMYKTGHSLIKNRMKEVNAPFAAEMSGHFFFTDRWYGFDCGIYSAARLLEILAKDERSPEQVLSSLPNDISTPELKVEMEEGENHAFIETFVEKARFADAKISTIDGLRADYEYGWGLVRASNTTPILVVRFEADTEESLAIIQEAFRMQMMAVNPNLQLPF